MESINLTPNKCVPLYEIQMVLYPGSGTFLGMTLFQEHPAGYTKSSGAPSKVFFHWQQVDLSSIVTKGLLSERLFAYDFYDGREWKAQNTTRPINTWEKMPMEWTSTKLILTEKPLGYTTYNVSNRAYYLETSVNYDRTFGKHTVNGLLLEPADM